MCVLEGHGYSRLTSSLASLAHDTIAGGNVGMMPNAATGSAPVAAFVRGAEGRRRHPCGCGFAFGFAFRGAGFALDESCRAAGFADPEFSLPASCGVSSTEGSAAGAGSDSVFCPARGDGAGEAGGVALGSDLTVGSGLGRGS